MMEFLHEGAEVIAVISYLLKLINKFFQGFFP